MIDVGKMDYDSAWRVQLELLSEVAEGSRPAGVLMLVEHPPVVTIGRHPNAEKHLLAPESLLKTRGVEVVQTDRGGDITFHGPGQLVAYPIIPLNTYRLNLHAYMRFLEECVIRTLTGWNLQGLRDPGATGVWIDEAHPTRLSSPSAPPSISPSASDSGPLADAVSGASSEAGRAGGSAVVLTPTAKICAMGVKLKRWITMHGLALNVTTDLSFFGLINPCGLSRPVTSMQKLLGADCPSMPAVKTRLAETFRELLDLQRRLGAKEGPA